MILTEELRGLMCELVDSVQAGIERKIGRPFSLVECHEHKGGIWVDPTMCKVGRVGVFAFIEHNGRDIAMAADAVYERAREWSFADMQELEKWLHWRFHR